MRPSAPIVEPNDMDVAHTRRRGGLRQPGPAVFVLCNAIAFYLVRPGVPDLWAARARASAAGHGVGLSYWFAWFGGSTPGNYSVITPYLCAKLGTELTAAVAAVLVTALVTILVRGTPRALPAAYVAAFGVIVNLWCGRVPFLVGCLFAAAAVLCVSRRLTMLAPVPAILSALASPVAGVFLCLGLSGVLVTGRIRRHRTSAVLTVSSAGAALVGVAATFGVPGPEPLPLYLVAETVLALALMLAISPADHVRNMLLLCGAAVLAFVVVPNGMGANLVRLALFCLPPAAVALSRRRATALAALAAPILVLGALSSTSAFVSAAQPGASPSYYRPLIRELDTLPMTVAYRTELVSAGHAAYAALLDHATLARGWETQQDSAFHAELTSPALDASRYREWLDDNAVGLIAVNLPGGGAEGRLILASTPGYLRPVWRSAHWRVFAVNGATPIVSSPAVLAASTQSVMTVRVPCSCRVSVRVRWSRFLSVHARLPSGVPDALEDSYRPRLLPGSEGWSTLETNRAGTFLLTGSL
jgi:hypothetical protein